jgi:hypothetical protein
VVMMPFSPGSEQTRPIFQWHYRIGRFQGRCMCLKSSAVSLRRCPFTPPGAHLHLPPPPFLPHLNFTTPVTMSSTSATSLPEPPVFYDTEKCPSYYCPSYCSRGS